MADVTAISVFVEGLLGFLSPCVLPIVPLYAAYLSGGTAHRVRLLINTLFFVAGIAVAFLVLGLAATSVGRLLAGYQDTLARVGGVAIALFGLLQLGAFGSHGVFERERRLPMRFDELAMSPLTALLMGFFFSFAWTPCVGPALASVLVMAGASATQGAGLALVGVYALGFSLPFVAVGLLADQALGFLRTHASVVRITGMVGGVLLVAIGASMVLGWTQVATRYFASLEARDTVDAPSGQVTSSNTKTAGEEGVATSADESTAEVVAAPDFVLEDQTGFPHYLSDYRGKVVFLNFWTTWCHYCQLEMPDIQQLYEDTGRNQANVVVLGVANPASGPEPGNAVDVSLNEVVDWLDEGGYTYPTLMDLTGNVFRDYGVAAYPTTFVIDPQGNVSAIYPGAMSRDVMDGLIAEAL